MKGKGRAVNRRSRILILALVLALMLPQCAGAVQDGTSGVYTYNFDYWGEVMESPDAYRAGETITSASLGLEVPMESPQSLYVNGESLYVVDRGNNRILELARNDGSFRLIRIIDRVTGADPETFSGPNDIATDQEGNLYVADTNNNRIVVMDPELNYIRSFTKPTDSTFDQSADFLPSKLVVDSAGRVFALATNVNKGLVKYEADGTFAGFIGANKVSYNMWDYIWKKFFSTKEQRAQQASLVPTEYRNIYIDSEGFIYATNTTFSEGELLGDAARPIRRLNSLGNDILIKNDRYPPIGDLYWEEGLPDNNYHGPSKLYDITVLDNDIYVAIDRMRGRVFGYDAQGIMLWAFGTRGSTEGTFNGAVSIEHMGTDLIVLDEYAARMTVFKVTEYGQLIYTANNQYVMGEYDDSAATWKEVQKLNANYPLAYIGIGRAQMRQDDFEGAMDNFKKGYSRVNYSKAYRYYRQQWMEKNILWVVLVILALAVFFVVRGKIRKTRWEVNAHDRSKLLRQHG